MIDSIVTISHPTDLANFSRVNLGGVTHFYFSYNTVIAFFDLEAHELVVSENNWSKTTEKHLNWIDQGIRKRYPHNQFETRLNAMLTKIDLSFNGNPFFSS